jgi:Uma2 family endonuclease
MDARVTDYADGLKRRAFTNADVAAMVRAGLIGDDESFELLRGEIVPMPSEFDLHGRARWRLQAAFFQLNETGLFVATELSLFLFDDTEVRPDLHIFDADLRTEDVRGPDVKLAVELCASSHHRDFKVKHSLYALAGVAELWIVDLEAREGHVFREPTGGDYATHLRFATDAEMSPSAFPALRLRVADLLR